MTKNNEVWFAMSVPVGKELETQILLQHCNIEAFLPMCQKITSDSNIQKKCTCNSEFNIRQINTNHNQRNKTVNSNSAAPNKTRKRKRYSYHRFRTNHAAIYHNL